MVWNHQQYLDTPILLKEEKSIRAFRNWFSQFYSPNSKSIAQLRDERMDWWFAYGNFEQKYIFSKTKLYQMYQNMVKTCLDNSWLFET